MKDVDIAREIALLPPEAQKQVMDFVSFLRARYSILEPMEVSEATVLEDEPFVGMWQDREDMRDSVAWVQAARRCEWEPTE